MPAVRATASAADAPPTSAGNWRAPSRSRSSRAAPRSRGPSATTRECHRLLELGYGPEAIAALTGITAKTVLRHLAAPVGPAAIEGGTTNQTVPEETS